MWSKNCCSRLITEASVRQFPVSCCGTQLDKICFPWPPTQGRFLQASLGRENALRSLSFPSQQPVFSVLWGGIASDNTSTDRNMLGSRKTTQQQPGRKWWKPTAPCGKTSRRFLGIFSTLTKTQRIELSEHHNIKVLQPTKAGGFQWIFSAKTGGLNSKWKAKS